MIEDGWEQVGPIEVHTTDGIVSVRAASDKLGDELVLDRSEWTELVRLAKEGSLDHI